MKAILRNLQPATPLNLSFAGTDVVPNVISIQPLKSGMIETSLSVLEFRKIPDVATALGAGYLSISAHGGVKVLN